MNNIMSEAKKELIDYISNYSNLHLTIQPTSTHSNKLFIVVEFHSLNNINLKKNPNFIKDLEMNFNSLTNLSKDFYNPFHFRPIQCDKYYKSFLRDFVNFISEEKDQQKYSQKMEFFLYNMMLPNCSINLHFLPDIIDYLGLESVNNLLNKEQENNISKGLIYHANNYIGKQFMNSLSSQCKKDSFDLKIDFCKHLVNHNIFNNKKFTEAYINKFIIKFLQNDKLSLFKVEKFYPPLKQHFQNLNNQNLLNNSIFKNNFETFYLDSSILNSFALNNNYNGNIHTLLNIVVNNFNNNENIKEHFNILSINSNKILDSSIQIFLDCKDKQNLDRNKFENILIKVFNECIYGKAISNKYNEVDTYINKIVLDELLDKPQNNKGSNKLKI